MISRTVVGLGLLAATALVFLPTGDASEADEREAAVIRMPPEARWRPAAPGEGMLAEIVVTASAHTPLMGVRGTAAGEELHFRRVDDRTFVSFAGVPVSVGDSVRASITVAYESGGEGSVTVSAPVTAGTYRHERLTVAPRFGAPPSTEDSIRLASDRRKARAVAARAHRTPWMAPPEVRLPRSTRVTSGFGDGREFNGNISSRHMGLDLRGARGDTAYAAAAGVVELVDGFLLAGNLVYVSHGAGVVTGYFHLNRALVEAGDTVAAGDPIGLVGATGRVTGPHLHWVLRYGSISLDPRSLLDVVGGDAPES